MEFDESWETVRTLLVDEGLGKLWKELGQHDPFTELHSKWVAHLGAQTLSNSSCFREKHSRIILSLATHDIGKLAISKDILAKTKLSREELELVRYGHVQAGWDLLHEYPDLQPAAGGHHIIQEMPYAAQEFNWDSLAEWQEFSVILAGICDMVDRMFRGGFRGGEAKRSIEYMRKDLKPDKFPLLAGYEEIVELVLSVATEQRLSPFATAEIGGTE